jgi:large subunit ribosomal protein L22
MAEEKSKEKRITMHSRNLRISPKDSAAVCKKISTMNLEKGKSLLENLISKKRSLNGKYYTNTSKELLKIMNTAESNAEFRGLDPSRVFPHVSASRGFTFRTPRRFKLRRKAKKMTNILMTLEQR